MMLQDKGDLSMFNFR